MPPVDELSILAGDMAFGKTGHADGKIGMLANELDELARKFEPARSHFELAAAGGIATQSENVLNTESPNLAEQVANLFLRCLNAGQMSYGSKAVLALNA